MQWEKHINIIFTFFKQIILKFQIALKKDVGGFHAYPKGTWVLNGQTMLL